MVNAETSSAKSERRERDRPRGGGAAHVPGFGFANLNPFGDLHALQHLSARLARPMRGVFEPLLRAECRIWAEPLVVQRFEDYRAERPDGLTAWLPLAMSPGSGQALLVMDGRLLLELLDLFFGGSGAAPIELPSEFSPAAEALAVRLASLIAAPLSAAWEPLARIGFAATGTCEGNAAMLGNVDGEDAMVVTRFGVGCGERRPSLFDLVYPVAALKPHGTALTGKVLGRDAVPDPAWRNGLTRAAMGVKFKVRSVLAEPVIPLGTLMALKPGDVIPISFGHEVPVMVGRDRLGTGTVGASNGHAAIRLNTLASQEETNR